MSKDDDFLQELKQTFLDELEDILEQVEAAFLKFEKDPTNKAILHEIFRYFHNIKGSSKTVGLVELSNFAHRAENLLAKLRNGELTPSDSMVDCLLKSSDIMLEFAYKSRRNEDDTSRLVAHAEVIESFLTTSPQLQNQADVAPSQTIPSSTHLKESKEGQRNFVVFDEEPSADFDVAGDQVKSNRSDQRSRRPEQVNPAEEHIKVPMNKINQILDLFGEQVILQSALDHAMESDGIDLSYINKSVSQLKKITQDLQYTMVTLRMISLQSLFNRMERTIRDVSKLTGKPVKFVKQGQSSELDKSIADALIDPLTHMVRNAVDHGIESTEMRVNHGKPEVGTVKLTAQRSGGAFEIIVEDDGKGLDAEKLRAKAISKGLIKEDSKLDEGQVYELIFSSGFSTIEKANEISGRGVGMDVVKQQLLRLKGECDISSELGRGTKFTIRVPLSLAMFNGTVIAVNGQRYVVPNSDFSEALNLKNSEYENTSKNTNLIRLGDRIFRVIDLRKNLIYGCYQPDQGHDLSRSKDIAIITKYENQHYALLINDIISQEQIVLKELGPEGKQIRCASGGTILGDGNVALVLDLPAIIKHDRNSSKTKAI